MKKILSVALLAVMVLSAMLLSGCGKDNDSDWSYIEDKGTLIVGLDDTFAPMGFRDKNNKIVGFDIDLAKAVAKKLDIKVEFQPVDWDAKEAELKSKNIDCIWNGLSATDDRMESMTLSDCYCQNRILLMSNKKSVNVKSVDQLKKTKIGTQAGSAALEAIEANDNYDDFKDNVTTYDTYDEALLDLKAGRIDVVAIDEVYAIYNNKNKSKLYESDFNFGADYYAIGFRKGDTELAEKVNDALSELMENGEAAKISKKWFGKNMMVLEGYESIKKSL